jgi:hypothetical protein
MVPQAQQRVREPGRFPREQMKPMTIPVRRL